jgi:hypothetical protein
LSQINKDYNNDDLDLVNSIKYIIFNIKKKYEESSLSKSSFSEQFNAISNDLKQLYLNAQYREKIGYNHSQALQGISAALSVHINNYENAYNLSFTDDMTRYATLIQMDFNKLFIRLEDISLSI